MVEGVLPSGKYIFSDDVSDFKHMLELHNFFDNVNDIKSDKPFTENDLIMSNIKMLQNKKVFF